MSIEEVDEAFVEEVEQAFERMAQLGLVEKTGQYREGRPVWALTDLGRHLSDQPDDPLIDNQ